MNTILRTLTATALSGIFLSGCMSQKEEMIREGYPASYADGFDDGCHSGKKAGGNMFEQFKKDTRRFEYDSQYAQGWSDGFRQCETEEESTQRQIRMNIEQQRYLQHKKEHKWEDRYYFEKEILKGVDTRGLENLR